MKAPSGHADTCDRVMVPTIMGRRIWFLSSGREACDHASLPINAVGINPRRSV